MFQRLIAERKFLATFYTRPESAALLAHLAIPDDGGWSEVEQVKDFRMIPLHTATAATGTGEDRSELDVDMPSVSQNLVIMNPPLTRPALTRMRQQGV